jgi:hypothetical protein
MPRFLADYDALGLPPDEGLRAVLARADTDSQFRLDLDRLAFQPTPMLADELDCHAAKFFVIAMDGGGNAFGLYVDDEVARAHGTPWVMWDHEEDALLFIADDTADFFTQLLDFGERHRPDDPGARRVREVLKELGLQLGAPGSSPPEFFAGRPAAWLPDAPLSR